MKALRPWLWFPPAAIVGLGLATLALRERFAVSPSAGAFRFERPWFALLLLAVPALLYLRLLRFRLQAPRLLVSRGQALASGPKGLRARLADLPASLRATALGLFALALMGPQSIHAKDTAEVDGIDIMLVLDLSLSMQAADIRPNRFEATKQVVREFIERRPNDRIGAVIFGREAYTLLPLTTDHTALDHMVGELELEAIDGRGTAIGNAVATGLNRLRRSRAKSKTIILLTDGNSNSGNVSPEQAAEFAESLGVKIYSVLMGATDDAPSQTAVDLFGRPVFDRGNFPVDPKLLRTMATRTGGEAFEVSDREALGRTFHRILDRLEKTKVEDPGKVYGELYPAFLGPGLLFLALELGLGLTLLRRWP